MERRDGAGSGSESESGAMALTNAASLYPFSNRNRCEVCCVAAEEQKHELSQGRSWPFDSSGFPGEQGP